jgi:hypothetical protein
VAEVLGIEPGVIVDERQPPPDRHARPMSPLCGVSPRR